MKKHLLFLFLLFVIYPVKGQTGVYHPFPDSNAIWKKMCSGVTFSGCSASCCSGMCISYKNSIDSLGGDTIIGPFTYKKVFYDFHTYENFSGPTTCPPGCFPNPTNIYGVTSYEGAIRQDTSARKVYFVFPSSTLDKLLYDFSLNVGDTLSTFALLNSENNYVLKIDSILIGGLYHKRFWLWEFGYPPPGAGSDGYVAIIEGIGSTFGLFSELKVPFEENCGLSCVKINSTTVYPNGVTTCPSIPTLISESENSSAINIFPNPTSDLVNLTAPINTIIEIRNLAGQIVSSFTTAKQNSVIDTHLWSAGVYTVIANKNSVEKLVVVK